MRHLCRNSLGRSLALHALVCLLVPAIGFASFDLSLMPRKVPLKNDYYSIQKVQNAAEPGILRFQVYSPHTVYDIEGFLPLMKLLQEIEIIERVKHENQGSGFLEGASDSVEATAVGIGNLVGHPVESAKGLGKAAGKLGKSVGGVFRKKEEGEKSSLGEKVLGSNQREIAKKIGADVYTRNPNLKSMIDQMARSRMGGQSAVMVIKFLIPVIFIASIAMTAGSLNTAADKMVNDTDRKALYKLNKEAFLAMGFENASVLKFLDRGDLTPREQTYFRFYMDALKRIEGAGSVYQGMMEAKSGWDGLRKLYEAQMAAGGETGKFAKIWNYPEGIAVLELSGRMIFFTAYDSLDSGELGDRILTRIRFLRSQNQVPVEIRNGGYVSDDFRADAQRQKVGVKAWGFFEDGENNGNV